MPRVKAFNACGRFRVMVATAPSRPNRISCVSAIPYALRATRHRESQRDDQQGIDLLAVEDDEAFDKAERRGAHMDPVYIAAGGEQTGVAVKQNAQAETMGAHLSYATLSFAEPGRAEDVAVAVRFID